MPRLDHYWQSLNPVALALLPLALLFASAAALRRGAYRVGLLRRRRFDVPVVVVGNITVGGTGKTPLVVWLTRHLRSHGWRPGIVSRGYGGRASHWPQQVRADSDVGVVGDEAVMLAEATGCPMCVGPDRPAAVQALLDHANVDIVISDDGLQHYALARNLEIVVVDGQRRLGNGLPLPAGPLREPRSRLRGVDIVVVNGEASGDGECAMAMRPGNVTGLRNEAVARLQSFAGRQVHAVAGIGNPTRFFDMLRDHGLEVIEHCFDDHHRFRAADLSFDPALPVLMTGKDAVKCRRLPCDNCWVVGVEAQPDARFVDRLNLALKDLVNG
ncbi:MAG: tetraacyldisaccharide 4'-kinase [Gammaproteobacteria bacterium]|nr:tetraacyldisaccharide 4'-kinase [Gammaproteobacteria bacterium]